jgi:hypothetical protein
MLLAFRSIIPLLFLGFTLAPVSPGQEFLPQPPADRGLIYVLDRENKLTPLPFESAASPLHPEETAKSTRTSYIELKGEHSTTTLSARERVFLFTIERGGAHPPLLVRLTPRRGGRRVTAVAQKGLKGFAISSEEIIRPALRGLAKNGEEVFMELRPRISLIPGEYAIIGGDLNRVVSFRVVAAN